MEIVGVGGINRPSVEGVTGNFPLRSDDPPDFFSLFPNREPAHRQRKQELRFNPFVAPREKDGVLRAGVLRFCQCW